MKIVIKIIKNKLIKNKKKKKKQVNIQLLIKIILKKIKNI